MDNNALYNTIIEVQPKQNIHFRYESGIKRDPKHGVLSGQDKKQYPKIKLTLPQNNYLDNNKKPKTFFVLCSLHSFQNVRTLSPHLLIEHGETEINYRFIFKEMEILNDNPLERVWELKNYFIVNPKIENYKKSLENKKLEFIKLNLKGLEFERLLGPLNLTKPKSIKDNSGSKVCLGFTIFEKDSNENTYSLYKDTVYSCVIYHGDNLNIYKLCNTKGSVLGGTDVNIFIKYETNPDLIVFIKKDEWSEMVEPKDKFNNSGISFTMPKYNGPECNDDEIEVDIYVMVKDTTYKSDSRKFYYVNEKSRKRTNDPPSQPSTSKRSKASKISYISSDYAGSVERPEQPAKDVLISKIDQIFNQCVSHEFKDSVFYDALVTEDAFIHLYMNAVKSQKKEMIANFRNDNGENLLHWVCKINHHKKIFPLIGLGCHINEQDHLGRTPLHVALTAQNKDCILEIQKLFKKYTEYSEEVQFDLVKMMKAYNDNGYTVLHETMMLADYNDLFDTMLEFMEKHKMNVLDYPVLGNGDSIGHLAIEKKLLKNIRPILEKYKINYETSENYAGVMVKDLLKDEIVNEFENLNI